VAGGNREVLAMVFSMACPRYPSVRNRGIVRRLHSVPAVWTEYWRKIRMRNKLKIPGLRAKG